MRLIPVLAAATLGLFVANATVYADPAPQTTTDNQADSAKPMKKMTKKQKMSMKKKQMMMKKDGM